MTINIDKTDEVLLNSYIFRGKQIAEETDTIGSAALGAFALGVNEHDYTALLLAEELDFNNDVAMLKRNGKIVLQDDEFVHLWHLNYTEYENFVTRKETKALTLALNKLNETLKNKNKENNE